MTSKIKVDNINKVSDDSTIIKKCGSTTTVGSGSGQTIVVDGATVTLGRCGGAVNLASGATQSGFGRSGSVTWQTTPKTATFTAADGEGYFCNTTAGAFTANLPAGSAGAIVSLADYAGTFQNNNLTVSPNGTDKIGGENLDVTLKTEGQSVTLVFVDSTEGWVTTADSTENVAGNAFISATGGTITESGNDKIHTFNADGNFIVSAISPTPANNQVSYLVVGGGGGGGGSHGAGAGAGGFREDKSPVTPYTASPLEGAGAISVTAATFPIVVGGGGAAANPSCAGGNTVGGVSTFSTITSAGGGKGSTESQTNSANAGGSGGGGTYTPNPGTTPGGAGNTPPVSPPQGNNGGDGGSYGPGAASSGGGGGATAVGTAGTPSQSGPGGAGATTSINGSPVARGGGGAGGATVYGAPTAGTGGTGGGGAGAPLSGTGVVGTANTGGGGGGGSGGGTPSGQGATGGSGVVIIRYKFQ